MLKKKLNKSIKKSIYSSVGRFLSIMLLMAFGSFALVGLFVAGPDMRKTGENYFNKYNVCDISVISDYGIDAPEKEAIENASGIKELEYIYLKDVVEKEEKKSFRIYSMSEKLSFYELVDGNFPMSGDEIAIDSCLANDYKIGDKISFTEKEDEAGDLVLKNTDFKVVGFVKSTEVLSSENRGQTTVGTGELNSFGIVEKDVFDSDVYMMAKISFKDMEGLDPYGKTYKSLLAMHKSELEGLLKEQQDIRLADIKAEHQEDIDEARKKIDDAKEELEDVRKKLKDADTAIEDAKVEIEENDEKLSNAKDDIKENEDYLKDKEKEYDDAKETFDTKRDEYNDGKKEYEDKLKEYNDSSDELDEKEDEYEDAKYELADSKADYEDAVKQLAESQGEYKTNSVLLAQKQAEYDVKYSAFKEKKDEYEAGLKLYNEKKALFDAGQKEIEDKQKELDTKKVSLEKGKKDYEDGIAKLKQVIALKENALNQANFEEEKATLEQEIALYKAQLQSTKDEYNKFMSETYTPGIKQIESYQTELDSKKEEMKSNEEELNKKEKELNEYKTQIDAAEKEFSSSKAELDKKQKELDAAKDKIDKANKKLAKAKVEIENGEIKLAEASAKINAGKTELEVAKTKLDAAKDELDDGKKKLDDAEVELSDAKVKIEDGKVKIQDAKDEYNSASKKLSDAKKKLSEKEKEYQEKLEEFNEKEPEALEKIESGEKELKDAQEKLDELEKPTYSVDSRREIPGGEGYKIYGTVSEIVDSLAKIFPVFLYFVAALVTFTTMTRFVSEERINSGTLKGLGYTDWDITKKFVIYGFAAGTAGTVLGIFLGHTLLPYIVYSAYKDGLLLPKIEFYFYPGITLVSIALSFISSVLPAYVVAKKDLREKPAPLLLPKAPKAGSKIFLERIKPIWNNLSFTHKVTARNIFRYKSRMFMTIFGVAGSVCLLFTGFSMQGSISTINDRQFNDIIKYDIIVALENNLDDEEKSALDAKLNSDSISSYSPIHYEAVTKVAGKNNDKQEIRLIATQNMKTFDKYISLIDRKTKKSISLANDGVVISERLSTLLNVSKGDTIKFTDEKDTVHEAVISDVCEMYAGHFIFMSDSEYEKIYDKDFKENAELILLENKTIENTNKQAERFIELSGVKGVVQNTTLYNQINTIVNSLDKIMKILIVVAAMLAIVILYNLTNINVSERIRELSTIKVLGFYDNEVTMYIYRETILLSAIGIVFGWLFGIFLHAYILYVVPPDEIMFNPSVVLLAYIVPMLTIAIVTIILKANVNRRLKKLDMLEALKSVD